MIRNLSEAFGISGFEYEVREQIKACLDGCNLEITEDTMGNLSVSAPYKEGLPTVILSAHMDESGFIITDITEDGYLKFDIVGTADVNSLLSKRVRFENVKGVISFKAVHLTTKEEREKPIKVENLLIDIGADTRADAEKAVSIGDYGVFDTQYAEFGKNFVKGKALGGRTGVNILVKILKEWQIYDLNLVGLFTVQRYVISRGMALASANIPSCELAIVVDSVDATPQSEPLSLCENGVAICFSPNISDKLRKIAESTALIAKKNNIACQRVASTEKTDADRMLDNGANTPVLLLAVPCKYKNTGVNLISRSDIDSTEKLINLILRGTEDGTFK